MRGQQLLIIPVPSSALEKHKGRLKREPRWLKAVRGPGRAAAVVRVGGWGPVPAARPVVNPTEKRKAEGTGVLQGS